MRSGVAVLRSLLCATLVLASACCPDARPARKASRADSEDSISVLAAALARAIDRGNGPVTAGERQTAEPETRAAESRQTPGGRKKSKAPTGGDEDGRDEPVPKPKFTREMLEKAIEKAAKEITPENADQALESLRKELESGTGTGESKKSETGEEVGDDDTADDVPETDEDQSTDGGQPDGGD